MSIPNYGVGRDVLVVPLTTRYNKNFMPMDANGEIPVSTQWFNAGDVYYQVQRPDVASKEIDTAPVPVKPRVLDPRDFLKGGSV